MVELGQAPNLLDSWRHIVSKVREEQAHDRASRRYLSLLRDADGLRRWLRVCAPDQGRGVWHAEEVDRGLQRIPQDRRQHDEIRVYSLEKPVERHGEEDRMVLTK